jgi:hypothetical protein
MLSVLLLCVLGQAHFDHVLLNGVKEGEVKAAGLREEKMLFSGKPVTQKGPTAFWHWGEGAKNFGTLRKRLEGAKADFVQVPQRLNEKVEFAEIRLKNGALVEVFTADRDSVRHLHLYSVDVAGTAKWYQQTLGFKSQRGGVGAAGNEFELSAGEAINLLITARPPATKFASMKGSPVEYLAFILDDFEGAVERLKKQGRKVADYEQGVRVTGPEGVELYLIPMP